MKRKCYGNSHNVSMNAPFALDLYRSVLSVGAWLQKIASLEEELAREVEQEQERKHQLQLIEELSMAARASAYKSNKKHDVDPKPDANKGRHWQTLRLLYVIFHTAAPLSLLDSHNVQWNVNIDIKRVNRLFTWPFRLNVTQFPVDAFDISLKDFPSS